MWKLLLALFFFILVVAENQAFFLPTTKGNLQSATNIDEGRKEPRKVQYSCFPWIFNPGNTKNQNDSIEKSTSFE